MKILHILYQSHPNISGSSTRTKDILTNQKNIGLEPIAISSPFQKGEQIQNGCELIYGIKHFRTYSGKEKEEVKEDSNSFWIKIKKFFRILNFKKEIIKVVQKEKPEILHAHAMFFCAYPAIRIGKRMSIPVVYEVRSLWEERRKDSNPNNIIRQIEFWVLKRIETYCMKNADHIVAINENLKQDLINRGIPGAKVTVIGNAVDIDFIKDQKKRMGNTKNEAIVFGYVGSISPIEGLNSLVEIFKTTFGKNKLLIYGKGKDTEITSLKKQISTAANIEYCGQIERKEIYKAYEKIDVIVNPRIKLKITDAVTPLKPLEAMAFGKIVIASDVGGMKELLIDGETGFLYEADKINNLEKCLIKVLNLNTEQKQNIIKNAIEYIQNNRVWLKNAEKYALTYQILHVESSEKTS
jgi:glycosyltransferase involved in cell wall biosynthesis